MDDGLELTNKNNNKREAGKKPCECSIPTSGSEHPPLVQKYVSMTTTSHLHQPTIVYNQISSKVSLTNHDVIRASLK